MIKLKDIPDTAMSVEEIYVKPDETDLVELIQDSEYHGVIKMMELLEKGDTAEVMRGLTDLRRMFKAQCEIQVDEDLIALMTEVVLWELEENTYRTPERKHEIEDLREHIAFMAKRYDFITEEFVKGLWEEASDYAFSRASAKIDTYIEPFGLTWEEVFEQDCEDYE